MFYKRFSIIFIIAAAVGVWLYFVADMRQKFPNPENIAVMPGEEGVYKGAVIYSEDIHICDYDGLLELYPELGEETGSIDMPYMMESRETARQKTYIAVEYVLENRGDEEVQLLHPKENLINMVIEAGAYTNGADYAFAKRLNPSLGRSLGAGEKQQIRLVFSFFEFNLSIEEAEQSDIRLVYSLYPTKEYLYYTMDSKN